MKNRLKKINKRLFCIFLFLVSIFSVGASNDELLRQIVGRKLEPTKVSAIFPLADGESFAQKSNNGKQILSFYFKDNSLKDTLFDIDKIKDCPIQKIEGFAMDSLEQKILVYENTKKIYRHSFMADYYVYNRYRNKIEPLSTGGAQRDAVFSPNGRMVAFARDNNIFIKKLDFNTETAITYDGAKDKIINGTADWVYEEEFAKTRYFEWSPDSKNIIFVRFDETDVKEFSFQIYGINSSAEDRYPKLKTYKYPQAGTANAKIEILQYNVFYKSTKKIDINVKYDGYIPKIQWDLTGEFFYIFYLNRNQNQVEIIACNAKSAVAKNLFTERSDTYFDYQNLDAFKPLPNNKFVWMSEIDGYRHLYLHNSTNGCKLQQITSGKWDVTAFYGCDLQARTFYYQSAETSPLERNIYSIDLKGKRKKLTNTKGWNNAQFSQTFRYFLNQNSNIYTPDNYSLYRNDGTILKSIEDNNYLINKISVLNLPPKDFFTFQTSDSTELNGWIVKPKDFDASKKYPVLMMQYGGPNSQQVRDKWSIDWEYYLAANGYIVVCVDGRGTGGRGVDFRTCTYMHLGAKECADQIETAQYLSSLPYVDATRIGIWGWSYGGYMVIRCMSEGHGIFKAGIAVAPVTDWRLYDSAYSERYMRRPQENAKGYEQACLLAKTDSLQGRLLIVHGTADDNVHLQNTLLYIEKLIESEKQIDLQLYPNKNHSILGEKVRWHLYKRKSDFIFQNL